MSRRGISPEDPRLNQLSGMRKRGMTQSEMARALGASQQTVSRLLRYLDSLSAGQMAAVETEPEANPLRRLIRLNDQRRAVLSRICEAYDRGDDVTALQVQADDIAARMRQP